MLECNFLLVLLYLVPKTHIPQRLLQFLKDILRIICAVKLSVSAGDFFEKGKRVFDFLFRLIARAAHLNSSVTSETNNCGLGLLVSFFLLNLLPSVKFF
jgi:hypothetical protein